MGVPFTASIDYKREATYPEKGLSLLSNYFYLIGPQATVIDESRVTLNNTSKVPWHVVAIKVVLFIISFPLTILLGVAYLVLRSRFHFTVIQPPQNQPPPPIIIIDKNPIQDVSFETITLQDGEATCMGYKLMGSHDHNLHLGFVQSQGVERVIVLRRAPISEAYTQIDAHPIDVLRTLLDDPECYCNLTPKALQKTVSLLGPSNVIDELLPTLDENQRVLEESLKVDPAVIQRKEGEETLFIRALLQLQISTARFLIKSMETGNVSLTPRELLLKKITLEGVMISQEELQSLSETDQNIAYRLANMYGNWAVVRILRDRRLIEPMVIEGPWIFGCHMDALAIHDALQAWLSDLYQQDVLVTQTQFRQYYDFKDDIGRVLGGQYSARKARELNLNKVKVPKIQMVIDPAERDLKLAVPPGLNVVPWSEQQQFSVHVEYIRPCTREITIEESDELVQLFEATGYTGICWDSLVVAQDGIYIINTKFENFWIDKDYFVGGHHYDEMRCIASRLPQDQAELFLKSLDNKIEAYCAQEEQHNLEQVTRYRRGQEALEKTGCVYGISLIISHPCVGLSNEM